MVVLRKPSSEWREVFLAAVGRSRTLHGEWVSAPGTPLDFDRYLARLDDGPAHLGYLVCSGAGDLTGVINVSEIVRGAFCSAYLGYYAFVPYHGKGYMRRGLERAISECFGPHGLHRLEANIQPANTASRRLVERLGFRLEGFSPRYLRIGKAWRDHERWAITAEEWEQSAM